MNKKLVSVIVPMYNAEKYVVETLDNLINQTYSNIEIIVVNDCSTDNSYKVVEGYTKKDDRIKLFANETNLGVAESRNYAISQAKGELIAFCDADDVWELEKLEKQINFMEENKCKICFSSIQFIDDDSKPLNKQFLAPEKVNYKEILKQNVITLSSAVVEKDLFDKYKFHHAELHEDFILWIELLKNDVDYAYGLKECLVRYRFTLGSKSRNKFKSLKMTYKTYRLMGLNLFKSVYYLCHYVVRSLKKYS